MYVCITDSLCCTLQCKLTILQLKKNKKETKLVLTATPHYPHFELSSLFIGGNMRA